MDDPKWIELSIPVSNQEGNRYIDINFLIADKTVENVIKNGISEYYDSVSGKPLGIRDYCMSATIATMMLDGLTKKYQLQLRT